MQTKLMPILSMHSRCLTRCHRHLGFSWSGQIFQSGVSLDEREGGEVSLPKEETCQSKFCKTSVLDRKNRAWLHVLELLQWVQPLGLKVLAGRATSGKRNHSKRSKLKDSCSTIHPVGPEWRWGWYTQFFQRTSLGYCKKLINILLLTSQNFDRSIKELFK